MRGRRRHGRTDPLETEVSGAHPITWEASRPCADSDAAIRRRSEADSPPERFGGQSRASPVHPPPLGLLLRLHLLGVQPALVRLLLHLCLLFLLLRCHLLHDERLGHVVYDALHPLEGVVAVRALGAVPRGCDDELVGAVHAIVLLPAEGVPELLGEEVGAAEAEAHVDLRVDLVHVLAAGPAAPDKLELDVVNLNRPSIEFVDAFGHACGEGPQPLLPDTDHRRHWPVWRQRCGGSGLLWRHGQRRGPQMESRAGREKRWRRPRSRQQSSDKCHPDANLEDTS
mmetsp:Transcript_23927/g.57025  ORF Transcript_23927/g.57025 Transcript_23927/m.57025 type:complete len:284 (+) Transcript_23927:11-862(+)